MSKTPCVFCYAQDREYKVSNRNDILFCINPHCPALRKEYSSVDWQQRYSFMKIIEEGLRRKLLKTLKEALDKEAPK